MNRMVLKKSDNQKNKIDLNVKVINSFVICDEITLKLNNDGLYFISRDGISYHKDEKHFHDCLHDSWMMKEAFFYKHAKTFPKVLQKVLSLTDLGTDYKKTIVEYFC